VLKAAEYRDAKELSVIAIGKKLSKQAFNIIDKIREVNTFLLSSQNSGYTIREIHPELCFWGLNKRQAMKHSKKRSAGFEERLSLLENHLPNGRDLTNRALMKFKRSEVAKDDILDALVGMVVASTFNNKLKTLPASPQLDSRGLPMEIVYTEQPNDYAL
jgi:predicted RNase H-like nuclease